MWWWSLVAFAQEPATAPAAIPAVEEPAAEEPAAEEPAAEEPTAAEPTAAEPGAEEEAPAEAPGELEPERPVHRGPSIVDRVAASVNEDVVLLSEIYEIGADFVPQRCPSMADDCVREAEIEILDALVERTLIKQELAKLGMAITASDVDQAIDRTVQQYQLPDRQALRDEVERSGKRWDDYRSEMEEYIREQTFKGRVLAPRVSITEDELRDQYQRVARKVKTPFAHVSALGVGIPPETSPEDEQTILTETADLVTALNAGELTWDDAVRDYDVGVAGMFSGLEVTASSIAEPLAQVVFAAEVGVVQAPVRMPTPSGVDVLFVLRVDELDERSEVMPFEEVRDQLEDQVFQEKLEQAQDEWYQRARREAAVSIKL